MKGVEKWEGEKKDWVGKEMMGDGEEGKGGGGGKGRGQKRWRTKGKRGGGAEKRREEEREGRHNFTKLQGSDCVY